MLNLKNFRLPYREETAFGFLALCVFSVPLAFSIYSYENFESVKFAIFLLCVGASAIVFFSQKKTGNAGFKSSKYFFWLMAAFLFWVLLSSFFAQDHLYAIFGFYYRYTSGLVFYATLGAFIFLLVNLLDQGKLEFLLKITVFDGLLVALTAFFEGFGWIYYQGASSGGFLRGPSLLGNIDYSAMFLSCVLPFALYFFTKSQNFKAKIYYAFCAFFIVLAEFILASRGALLGIIGFVVLALLLLAVYKFPKKYFWILLVGTFLVGIGSYFFLQVSRPTALSSIVASADSNTFSRLYVWDVSFKGIKLHPLVGVGPGNYELFFEGFRFPQESGQIGIFDDAHNVFLQLAVTGGIPLALLFLSLILLAAFYGLKQLSATKDLFVIALFGSLAAWIVGASFNPVPIPMYMLLALLLVALVYPFAQEVKMNFVPWKKILLLVLAWLMVYWGAVNLVSEHLLGFGVRTYYNQNYKESYNLSNLASVLNPSNGLFFVYKTASEIRLDKNRQVVVNGINKIENLHKTQSNSYAAASNLYDLLYILKGNKADSEASIAAMQQAIKIYPLLDARYGQLALYYYQLGDFTLARNEVELDLGIGGQDFSSWVLLAKLYQIAGNKNGTVFALSQALKLDPGDPQLEYVEFLAKALPDVKQVPIEISAAQPDF